MKKLYILGTATALLIGIGIGFTARAGGGTFSSRGRLEANEVIFDASDFEILESTIEDGKQLTYDLAVEETISKVQASPKDYGIQISSASFETYRGFAAGHAGQGVTASIPEGYDVAVIGWYNSEKNAGSMSGATNIATGTKCGVMAVPLGGNARTITIRGPWESYACIGAVKLQ